MTSAAVPHGRQQPRRRPERPLRREGAALCRRRGLALLAAAAVLSAGAAPDEPAPFRDRFAALVEELRRDLAAMDRSWQDALAQPAGFGPGGVHTGACLRLRLRFEGVAFGRAMESELLRWQGGWLAGRAWSPVSSQQTHQVESHDLALLGTPAPTALVGRVSFLLLPDTLSADLRRAAVLRLHAAIRDGAVSGRYVVAEGDEPSVSGTVTGTFADVRQGAPALLDRPLRVADSADGYDLYAVAVRIETLADRLYDQIRAMEIARLAGISPQAAQARTAVPHPLRPPFRPGRAPVALKAALPVLEEGIARRITEELADFEGHERNRDWSVEKDRNAPLALGVLQDVRQRVSRLRAAVERHLSAGPSQRRTPWEGQPPADPLFGPWYGTAPLPDDGAGLHALPMPTNPAAATDVQRWMHVGSWRVLGPFPLSAGPDEPALLPDMIASLASTYPTRTPVAPPPRANETLLAPELPLPVPWSPLSADRTFGYARPPAWQTVAVSADGTGLRQELAGCTFYATAAVASPSNATLWVTVETSGPGRLWLNDRLLCAGPRPPRPGVAGDTAGRPDGAEYGFMAPADFVKGTNRLVVRADTFGSAHDFAVRICVAGSPRRIDAATSTNAAAARAAAVAAVAASPSEGVARGWRNRWNGVYPDAAPPLAWDLARGINVAWRTPLEPGNGSPVVAGDRIFALAEPHRIVCMDKRTGAVRWRRECSALESSDPAAWQEYRALAARAAAAAAAVQALGSNHAARALALRPGRSEAEADVALADAELTAEALNAAVAARFASRAWGPRLPRLAPEAGYTGAAMPTPVTDGTNVWTVFADRAAACFSLDGERRWLARLGGVAEGAPCAFRSPVLAEGLLIVASQAEARGANGTATYNALRAYAADTGEERWMAPAYGEGTPLPVRLTDGRSNLTVVVSQGGSAIRAEDGRVLAVSAQGRFGGAPLAAEGDVVIFRAPQRIAAVRLLMADRDRVGWKKLWDRSVPGNAVSGAVCHDGLVFELDGPVGDEVLNIVALPDGRRAGALRLSPSTAMPHSGIAPVIAGDWLFAMDSGRFPNRYTASSALRAQPPALCVVRAAARGRFVGRGPVEPMGAPPVFDGERMYLRSVRALTCIARGGEEGERFEAASAFRSLADGLFADVPGRGAAVTVPPSPGRPAPSWPVPAAGTLAPQWIGVGPLPAGARTEALKAMGPLQTFRPQRGARLTVEGQPCEFEDLPLSAYTEYPGGWAVDALRAADERPGSVLFWYTVLDNPAARTLRVDCIAERAGLWMNGVPVRHNARVRLAPGLYPLLVEVIVPRRLPDSLEVAVRFWPSDNPESERAAWKEAVLTHREIVDRARRLLRGTEPGARARRILAAVE